MIFFCLHESRDYSLSVNEKKNFSSTESVCKQVSRGVGGGDLSSACSDLKFSFGLVEVPKMLCSKANGITLQVNKATLHIKTTAGGRIKDLLRIQIDIAVSRCIHNYLNYSYAFLVVDTRLYTLPVWVRPSVRPIKLRTVFAILYLSTVRDYYLEHIYIGERFGSYLC